ncbi:MAG: M43 family zinc metalloprotease, partial [Bacteroidota bacterium]
MVRYISSLVLILISVAMSTTSLSAQHTGHNHEECGTMHIDAEMRKKNPEMGTLKDFEMWMGPLYRRQKRKAQYRSVVTLPVVFHIIHHNDAVGSGQNWANSFIQEQMTQLNDDFRKRPGTAGFNNNPVGADTEIEFCLATVKPDGTPLPEPGVNRINAADSSWINGPYNSNFINNTIKPNTIYDPNNYINIWVCELDGNLLGFAQLPGASTLPGLQTSDSVAETDGVVIDGSTMGSVANPNSANINYGVGRTLTHELGHFFGLRHIWGDGDCNVDDYCDDTPDQSGPTTFTTNCPSDKTSCGSRDMYENYMDYTNDLCVNIFTLDQKARMDVVLANSPRRGSLINSTACQPLGGPVANFIADKVLIRAGETITFTDQSLGNPTNWSWTINGGTPSASTDQNPVVV